MQRNACTLENALSVLNSLLDQELDLEEALTGRGLIARLVVVHAVVQTFPRAFFVPNKNCLRQPYGDVLDFLVGDFSTHINITSLVSASTTLKWHEHVEPMPDDGRRSRVRLLTPPEVLSVLARHPNTVVVMTEVFAAARQRLQERKAAEQAAADWQVKLETSVAEVVDYIFDKGGRDLGFAVYQELKRIYG